MNDRGLKVLEQYDFEIISTRRGRGSYICETSRGLKLLCDFEGSEKKLLFQNHVLHRLREAGYEAVDTALENKEGKLVSTDRDENRYVVKDWYYGRECSPSGERDIMEAVGNLARLHCYLRFPEETEKEYCGLPLRAELEARMREMKKVRSFIRGREPKQPFERLFLQSFPVFYEQAQQVLEQAEEVGGEAAMRQQLETGSICHGDYNYHHVLFLERGMATTNFGKCRYDYQVLDLCQFLRKILEKQNWDLRLGEQMLNTYDKIRPLPRPERKILYLKLAYPEKFWKLANHYYGSRKAWLPARFEQKLEALNRQQKQRNTFLKLLE
ncbi:MAG: CotS family spore coat protein [Lachnospiraceae bacterium]|nr:CotS family spore coat protein [Lachnospiraceae bacterium]